MLIQGDMTQAPDRRTIVPAGFYEANILSVTDQPPKNAETKGTTIVVGLKIVNNPDPDVNGREMNGYTFIPQDLSRKDALTGIKRIFLSAGIQIQPGGMNTQWLVGRTVRIHVTNGTVKDDRSGTVRETANVNEFLIPGEAAPQQGTPQAPQGMPQPPQGMPSMPATMGAAPGMPQAPQQAPSQPGQLPAMQGIPQMPAAAPQMPTGFAPLTA